MAAAPIVGSPTPRIAHLCDVVLENLRSLADASVRADDAVKAFRGEIQTFRKFLDLIERVRRANSPRMAFEEDHFNDVKALLDRCRATLSRLCELLAAMRGKHYEAASPDPSRELRWDLNTPEISALRTSMGFYTQTLEMSLQTVKLCAFDPNCSRPLRLTESSRVYQWKSQLPQDGIYFHHKGLSQAIQTLRDSMANREGISDSDPQQSPLEEGAFMYDIEKCVFSAEAIMSITTTTVYDDLASPTSPYRPVPWSGGIRRDASSNSRFPTSPMNQEDIPSPLRLGQPPFSADRSKELTPDDGISPTIYELDAYPSLRPSKPSKEDVIVRDRRANLGRTKSPDTGEKTHSSSHRSHQSDIQSLSRREESIPSRPRKSEASGALQKRSDIAKDSQILFRISDIQNERGGNSDSDGDSFVDPEPDFEDGFSAIVYLELITATQQDLQKELDAGEYAKAEQIHRKAMKYYTDREKNLNIPFENQSEMHEILADIYHKQGQLDKAKRVLNRLLMQEKKETDRKWRLYHVLAEIFKAQNRLPEAEKYAKRAYIGREKSLEKGNRLVLQSVGLLIEIYEQQGETETAEAFKKVYRSESALSGQPRFSRDRTDVGSYRSGSMISHQSRPGSVSTNREDAILNKSRVRWAPDAWVDASSINAPTKSGETPMIAAIVTGDDELVRLMLQRGADVEARCADRVTPLMHAISHGYNSIAELLLSHGAQVDAPTSGWTPLHKATDLVNISMVSTLLAHGADIEAKSPKDFSSRKHPLGVLKPPKIDDSDDDHSSSNDKGWTTLLRAACNGEQKMVHLLLAKGADIEARNPSNGTPLICACERHHDAVVDMLLINGADVHAEDDFGWKPIHRALVNKGGELVAGLLLSRDADVNARDTYRKTPLHHAIEKGDDQMVHFLLNAGADIEARDIAERTPLHTAIEARLEIMVHILLEHGADTDAMDKGGRNALAAATHASRKSPEIIALLSKEKKKRKSTMRGSIERDGSGKASGNMSSVSRTSSSSSWWSIRSNKQKR